MEVQNELWLYSRLKRLLDSLGLPTSFVKGKRGKGTQIWHKQKIHQSISVLSSKHLQASAQAIETFYPLTHFQSILQII